mmetsp:Transcript_93737/g.227750  ORF Transcript_93737/g.227750 Transcript_93737/m.227750 type:complete len:254 (-) Transcript_93737:677-1438(-)
MSRVATVDAVAEADPGVGGCDAALRKAPMGKYQTPPWLPSGEGRPTMPCFGTSKTGKAFPSIVSVCSFQGKPACLKTSRNDLLSLVSLTTSPTLRASSSRRRTPAASSALGLAAAEPRRLQSLESRRPPSAWMTEHRANSWDAMFIRPSPTPLALPASSSMHSSCNSRALLAAPNFACNPSFSSRRRSSSRLRASMASLHSLWMSSELGPASPRSTSAMRSSRVCLCSSASSYCERMSWSCSASLLTSDSAWA